MTGEAAFGAEELAFQFSQGAPRFWFEPDAMALDFVRWLEPQNASSGLSNFPFFLSEVASLISGLTWAVLSNWSSLFFLFWANEHQMRRQEGS